MTQKKSINKILAECTADGGARAAKANPADKNMQRLAREFAERARRTK
jgi:hypothetical protein